MLECSVTDYNGLLGNIDMSAASMVQCMGQCTGCKCICQCSCRVSECSDLEWEGI